jgi:hypothetical protein
MVENSCEDCFKIVKFGLDKINQLSRSDDVPQQVRINGVPPFKTMQHVLYPHGVEDGCCFGEQVVLEKGVVIS